MRAVDIIQAKRDGACLSSAQIESFVRGTIDGSWPDYQLAALLMAIVWRGMNAAETAHLTHAMAHSGDVLNWSDIDGPKVDKHSSGGVGDKTSMVLVPLAAACGVKVPKMSGRGLGHTGGTLDKLEAIPGYRIDLSIEEFRSGLREVGAVIAGQTHAIAPADKRLYHLRDVTATVDSIPLITSSILSKKLAEGLDALVLDVKCGRGAFMKDLSSARALARSLAEVAALHHLPTTVFLTAMDQPLGHCIGHTLEVRECIDTLRGTGPNDLQELAIALAARMVLLGKLADDLPNAEERVRNALTSGTGLQMFQRMIRQQGGDERIIDEPTRMPTATKTTTFHAWRAGYWSYLDAYLLGVALTKLGGGRARKEDAIDHAVGFRLLGRIGDELREGDGMIEIHYRDDETLAAAWSHLEDALEIDDAPPESLPLILDVLNS